MNVKEIARLAEGDRKAYAEQCRRDEEIRQIEAEERALADSIVNIPYVDFMFRCVGRGMSAEHAQQLYAWAINHSEGV